MKLKHVLASAVALLCSVATWAQASYNHTYTEGVPVEAGENYFLYNIASGMFLTDGMDYGTHASIDHAGRVITLEASGGGYTVNTTPFSANGSALKNGGLFLNASGEPYVDGTSAEWTFEPVSFSGYTNAYLIKTGEKYLYIDYADGLYQGKMGSFVRSGSNTGDAKSYWLLIPMSARQKVHDYTYLLRNTDMCHPWEFPIWNNGNVNMCVGSKENVTAEAWHASFDFSQTISASIPNGKYTLHCQGFYYDTETPTVLYANSDQAGLMRWNQDCNAAQAGAKFLEGAYADNSVTTIVTDHTLKVGVTDPTNKNWQIFDNFYLEYFGSCVVNDAMALPDNGDMAADKWYYFNPGAGSFNLTATDLSKIVYTSDGTILTSAAGSISTTFGTNPVTLTNTTYYIKSSIANNFAYEADSYDLTEQKAAYNTAVTNAETAKTNAEAADKVNAAEKTTLDEAITRYGSIDYSGPQNKALKEALETATATLTSATNTVNTSITAYANAKAYFDAVKPVLETTNFYTSAAYATNYSTPKAAYEEGTLSDVDAAALSYGSRRDGSIPAILLSSWAGTTLYINTWSKESAGVAPARDFATPFFEYWVADGNNLAATTFTSTIGGLTPNALYAVTLNARVKQRDGNRKVADGITLKVGSGDAVDLTRGQHIAMTRRFIDSYTAYGYTNAVGELVTTITVAENSNISWLAFRDVNYAHVKGATALDKVIAEVTALNGHVPTNVYSTANTVVTKHTDANYPTTDAEFATAISEIRAAAATAAAYKSEYESYLELKAYADALVAVDNNNPLANSTLKAAISTAATNVNNVADVAALTSVNTTLKTAMVTYAGAANPVGDGNKFDLTFMLGKVKFDDCITWENPTVNGFDGWATEQSGGNFQVMENESVTSGDYHSFIEYWSANPQTNSKFNLYTTVSNLPEGTYTMSCYAFAGPDGYAGAAASSEVYFYANDTQGGKVSDPRLTQKEITFVNASEQDVKIGLKPVTGNTWRWMGIGYVKMYKTPAAGDVVLDESSAYDERETAADVLLTKTIYKGFNTLVLPFSMTSSEITTVLGDGKLYEFTGADAGSLNFNEVSTLAAHTPYLFKADADKIIRDERISGRTITVSTNSLKVAGTDYNLQGTYTPYEKNGAGNPIVAERDYVLGTNNNFYLTTTQNALKAFRAYIQANEASTVKALSICIDGETTAIESLNGETMTDGAIYNMAGQRVNKAVKGLYIVNGKKMLVK